MRTARPWDCVLGTESARVLTAWELEDRGPGTSQGCDVMLSQSQCINWSGSYTQWLVYFRIYCFVVFPVLPISPLFFDALDTQITMLCELLLMTISVLYSIIILNTSWQCKHRYSTVTDESPWPPRSLFWRLKYYYATNTNCSHFNPSSPMVLIEAQIKYSNVTAVLWMRKWI